MVQQHGVLTLVTLRPVYRQDLMANASHLSWILEGPEFWNKRRDQTPFRPDLSGIDLYNEFKTADQLDNQGRLDLQQLDLRDANLDGIRIRSANLKRANLSGAHLNHALFDKVDLTRARLDSASLEDTDFYEATLDYADLKWTRLQHAHLVQSSLRNAKLNHAKADRASFEQSNLTKADLSRASLEGASLKSTQLCSARLRCANLKRTCLDSANLTDAYLFGSDLSDASLVGANLSGANLGNTILTNTDLQDSNLTATRLERAWFDSTYLTSARPWKAILFREHNTTSSYQQEEHQDPVASIEEMLNEIRRLKARHGRATLYFRGEASCKWSLKPSVMRSRLRIAESAMLIDLMSRRPEDFGTTTSALAQWVLAQHHGLKTRFLDVTRNPLVALYCACTGGREGDEVGRFHIFAVPNRLIKTYDSDTIAMIGNFAKLSKLQQDVLLGRPVVLPQWPERKVTTDDYRSALRQLYHLIRTEKPQYAERVDPRDLFKVFVVDPQQYPERIRAQSGAFLVSAFHERFERGRVLEWNARIPIYAYYRLTLKPEAKSAILQDLGLLHITHESLFPGLDASAKAVVELHSEGDGVTPF